jgi:hypothetical protein
MWRTELRVPVTVAWIVVLAGAPAPRAMAAEVEDAAWGLRFTPPEGWVRQPAPEGYLFVAPDLRGLLAVLPHDIATVDELRAEAGRGIEDGAGTALRLQGAVAAFGDNGLAGDYAGWIEGVQARARFLWLQVVRFTPSRLVVEAEQLATGMVRGTTCSSRSGRPTAR